MIDLEQIFHLGFELGLVVSFSLGAISAGVLR